MATASKMLTRELILASDDIVTEKVDVPEWGGFVYVRAMTGKVRDALEASVVNAKKGKNQQANLVNYRAKIVVKSVVDDKGKFLFGSDSDVAALGEKSAAAISRIVNVAQRVSGITEEDVEELTEELKNDHSDGSGSD